MSGLREATTIKTKRFGKLAITSIAGCAATRRRRWDPDAAGVLTNDNKKRP